METIVWISLIRGEQVSVTDTLLTIEQVKNSRFYLN